MWVFYSCISSCGPTSRPAPFRLLLLEVTSSNADSLTFVLNLVPDALDQTFVKKRARWHAVENDWRKWVMFWNFITCFSFLSLGLSVREHQPCPILQEKGARPVKDRSSWKERDRSDLFIDSSLRFFYRDMGLELFPSNPKLTRWKTECQSMFRPHIALHSSTPRDRHSQAPPSQTPVNEIWHHIFKIPESRHRVFP